MSSPDGDLAALRAALAVSPENLPLRKLYARALLGAGRADDAEDVLLIGLRYEPTDHELSRLLARAYADLGRLKQALVVLEGPVQRADCPPESRRLYEELQERAGEREAAPERPAPPPDDPSVTEDGRVMIGGGPDDGADDVEPVIDKRRPAIRFEDVGGLEHVKEELRMKALLPLQNPELFQAYGKGVGGGVLVYGPPGCGKTLLARAVAGELGCSFLAVEIHDVLSKWYGETEQQIHGIFENARGAAPAVLFFDEVDALGADRRDVRSHSRTAVNQFLSELDGLSGDNEGLVILAATNAPWHLDPAFRRPGRFDRIVFVPPPDEEARAAVLRAQLKGKPVEDVDHQAVAKRTKEFSGADLKAVVDLAVEAKLREALRDGKPSPLRTKDLLRAAKQVKPSTKEWFASARNHALYANASGIYDDVLAYLGIRK